MHRAFLSSYTVTLPVYEGPLDLLLDLIERAELDITTLSLALVTEQYLAYLRTLEQVHPQELSAFLVIAARLLQIKSEALLPRPPQREAGEEDVGQALVEQLKTYKRFKEIGLWLEERQRRGLRSYLRLAPPPKIAPVTPDLSNLTLEDLHQAALRVLQKDQAAQALGTVITPPRITIREKIAHIRQVLSRFVRTTFRELLQNVSDRLEVVVTFLALLELVKRYRVQARQEQLFGTIEIERAEEWTTDEEMEIEFE
ncbi:MAG: segregation/condensation protein A [Anaerolineales bacterium]